jgi:sarcosine oxidase subunit alpha
MTARRIAAFSSAPSIAFQFDGKSLQGHAGDTIAAALIANGVTVVGRSFKYHRPRGVYGAWTEEPNALVDVTAGGKTTPNVRATTEPLTEGLTIKPGNASPTAENDRFASIDRFARFIPAGFYYKTFMWPNWGLFEPRIRAMAGLGHLDAAHEPPANCAQFNAHCDILVVGAGPAGLAAARAAAAAGKRVMLVDDQFAPGGSLLHRDVSIDGVAGRDWANAVVDTLRAAGASVLSRATAYGVYQHKLVCVWQQRKGQPDALWRVRAGLIVLATGAIERPLVFPDNDRPGVMSAEAALIYLKRYGVRIAERVVVATNNSRAYSVAAALRDAGAEVTLVDTRKAVQHSLDGVDVRLGATIAGVEGRLGVEAVRIGDRRVPADALLVSGGFSPTVHLYAQANGKLRYDERTAALAPIKASDEMIVIGAANCVFDLQPLLAGAHLAAGGVGDPPRASGREPDYSIEAAWPRPGSAGRQWIDFQNDVTVKDVELAARENFRSVEHLKRYTTLGMATDQGKTSNVNGLAAMAAITGRTIGEIGTTTYRPPFTPVPLPVLAGRRRGELFNPVKRLALETEHRDCAAVFREYSGWLRPAFYGSGESRGEIEREASIARRTVAVLDASPLGKIDVFGPDAGALVDYNSYNTLSSLKLGRIRYGFMLTEGGVIYDDGVVSKVSDTHYIVSCSSGHVQGVLMRLEEWRQDRFDPTRVIIHNSTAQWATLTATGPRARELLVGLDLGVDLSDSALPHMAFATGAFAGRQARVARVSFTGDRSYEVSVPALIAPRLFRAMADACRELGGCLLGSEALLLLRAEKGYVIAGKDTDGTTMPQDLGLTAPRDKRVGEFVGKRSLFTENALREDRTQFVGLTSSDATPLPTGAHAVQTTDGKRRSIGFVTSSYWSPILERPIALGLIERGLSRISEKIELVHMGRTLTATISNVCAFDPEGSRLNG